MDHNNIIECGGFYFIHNFDSGNLGHVERVPTELIADKAYKLIYELDEGVSDPNTVVSPAINPKTNSTETPDYEFNLWTRPDCAGTEFENGNRTWFYFGVQASEPNVLVRLNLINLNKQGKMYNQGMAPVTRTLPGKPQWERIRDRPVHSTDDNTFTLSFKYRTSDNLKATTFFAFTYPYSFAELQIALNSIDLKMLPLPPPQSPDDIYYYRECLIYSLEGRRVDLLTITSHHGITNEREERLKHLFPDNQERPFKFQNKKIIFISARVHPGETPSSFVFNGFLNLLLTRNDPIAIHLRKYYVFKMIPFLNPDGVARGHYRTDTRGVNLNRVYLNPSLMYHPSVYASRALIRYYHFGSEKEEDPICDDSKSFTSRSIQNISESAEIMDTKKTSASTSPYKREKAAKGLSVNKSSSTLKQPSDNIKRDLKSLTGEATNLAEQVYDMKLQEAPSQISETSPRASNTNLETGSLLDGALLRSCLGSTVHLSTSEELNLQGVNPLRPLRETLKNSISLLMESSSSVAGDSATCEVTSRVRMGWCGECRRAVRQLERSMPGIAAMVPGYSATMVRDDPTTYHSIDEYREHQRQQIDDQERQLDEAEASAEGESEYFCTNCFKRYMVSELNNEEIVSKVVETTSAASAGGDSGDALRPALVQTDALAGGARQQTSPVKEDKPKSTANKLVKKKPAPPPPAPAPAPRPPKEAESGLYLYIDLHGHASKKGIFMYGNHFEDIERCVECMLLPRIMALNNLHFHFSSCNFTERNMYLKDRRDGMSREGSGRVAVLKATGLVRSYTLECNYNTGRLVNVLPPPLRDAPAAPPAHTATNPPAPPKYTPHIFEEVRHCRAKNSEFFEEIDPMKVGRSLGASILDLTGQHPNSRIPGSEHRNLAALRDWLRAHTRTLRPQLTMSRLRPKTSSPSRLPLYARSKGKMADVSKENTYVGAKTDAERKPPRSAHDIITMNMKFAKKTPAEPVKTASKTRYLADSEPKKTLSTKRRNILAVRKPNASKTQVGGGGGVGGGGKAKLGRRSAEDADSPRASLLSTKLSKRSFSRAVRPAPRSPRPTRGRPVASSSSSEVGAAWEEPGGALAGAPKRRSFPHPSPSRLKKIRLKTAS